MADPHSTHVCETCHAEFPATLKEDGTPRKRKFYFCSARCRHKATGPSPVSVRTRTTDTCSVCGEPFTVTRGGQHTCGSVECRRQTAGRVRGQPVECHVKGCSSTARTLSMCGKHYVRWKKYGDPLFSKHGLRVTKACAVCGKPMSLTPSRAKKERACSRACGTRLQLATKGQAPLEAYGHCAHCHKPMQRKVRRHRDSGKYCSRSCAFSALGHLKEERAALHRIGDRRRAKEEAKIERLAPEIDALFRIGDRIRARTRDCQGCGKTHVRRYRFSRFCSEACKADHQSNMKLAYRDTEAYKAQRRRAKSKRRAIIRNAGAIDNIDPIEVFERDKWRCHLCKRKTRPAFRGTCQPLAPELDHIVSLADGGTHTWGNVACSCRECNGAKGAASIGQLSLSVNM